MCGLNHTICWCGRTKQNSILEWSINALLDSVDSHFFFIMRKQLALAILLSFVMTNAISLVESIQQVRSILYHGYGRSLCVNSYILPQVVIQQGLWGEFWAWFKSSGLESLVDKSEINYLNQYLYYHFCKHTGSLVNL